MSVSYILNHKNKITLLMVQKVVINKGPIGSECFDTTVISLYYTGANHGT